MTETLAPSRMFAVDLEAVARRHPEAMTGPGRGQALAGAVIVGAVALLVVAFWQMGIDWSRVVKGFGRLGDFASVMLPPKVGGWEMFWIYMHSLGESVAIAFLGTLAGGILALPFGFLAARNVVASRILHFLSRRWLDTLRGVNTLIWALIWINVVGLGPFAGVLAIMTAEFGLLGKLFSEAIEAADRKPVEGVVSTGGAGLHALRFGVLPQVVPLMIGNMLYQFESNTRSATIIGIVGAGGIGRYLSEMIRVNEWQVVSFLVIAIWLTVMVIDFVSTRVRAAIIG